MIVAGAFNPKISEGIKNEHTSMYGHSKEFETSNYGVKTKPEKEWEIAMGLKECPEEDMMDRKKRKVRVIRRIDALRTLEICRRAGLTDEEILAVVSAAALVHRSAHRLRPLLH